jgi:hypothetical protein
MTKRKLVGGARGYLMFSGCRHGVRGLLERATRCTAAAVLAAVCGGVRDGVLNREDRLLLILVRLHRFLFYIYIMCLCLLLSSSSSLPLGLCVCGSKS